MTKLFQSVTSKLKPWLTNTVAVGLMSAIILSTLFLFPIMRQMSTHLTSRADGIFIAWTIDWVSHALVHGQNIYDAPIFHPYRNTLAYSDPFFTSGLMNIFLLPFTDNIILQHNIHLVLGTILTYFAFFILIKKVSKDTLAAILSASFFTFSSLHFQYIVHLHTYLIAGIPLTAYFLLRWIEKQQLWWLVLCAACFLAQTLNSPMTGFFTIACIVPILLGQTNWKLFRSHWVSMLSILIITFTILALFYVPYFTVSKQFSYTRSIRDAAAFANSAEQLFTPELLLTYALIGCCVWKTKRIKKSNRVQLMTLKTISFIIIIGAVLMLGPVLKVGGHTLKLFGVPIPLPYALLYYLVPGFQAFRASSRWIIVFDFGMSALLGWSFAQWEIAKKQKIMAAVGLIGFLWVTQVPRLQLYQIPTVIDPIYSALSHQPEPTVAEFPIYIWSMNPYEVHENDRLLYQTYHRKQLYNGMSGFTPPDREQQWLTMSQQFPSDKTLNELVAADVQLVVVHFDEYRQLNYDQYAPAGTQYPSAVSLTTLIQHQPRLQTISCDNSACLYRIQK